MQKHVHVNLVDLVKSFPTNISLQNLASIRKRTSPTKFDHLADKSDKSSISNLSTKLRAAPGKISAIASSMGARPVGDTTVRCKPTAHWALSSSFEPSTRITPFTTMPIFEASASDASTLSKLNCWRLLKLMKIK